MEIMGVAPVTPIIPQSGIVEGYPRSGITMIRLTHATVDISQDYRGMDRHDGSHAILIVALGRVADPECATA